MHYIIGMIFIIKNSVENVEIMNKLALYRNNSVLLILAEIFRSKSSILKIESAILLLGYIFNTSIC